MTETTNSPSSNTGSWTNPTYAYADDTNYASSATNTQTHTYSGYGFSLTGETITKVEAGYIAYCATNDKLTVEISWDGGTNWASTGNITLTTTPPSSPTYYDFTSATTWTATKLSDTYLRIRITQIKQGGQDTTYVDWLPVRVTHNTPSAWSGYSQGVIIG
jgi:hypothetical protein